MESVNDARVLLFSKTKTSEALPPTKDALELHIKRVHYQSLVWKQASCHEPILPNPDGMGWKRESECGSKLVPLVMTKEPIPNAWKEIISCSCKSGCTALSCGCKKQKLFCTSFCGCRNNIRKLRSPTFTKKCLLMYDFPKFRLVGSNIWNQNSRWGW
jgi:hypothetical protein